MSLIQLNDVTKTYRTGEVETLVLRGISLDIAQGEFLAIMGPSGSGKSTLMNIMGFLDDLTTGEYIFDGRSAEGYDEEEQADIRSMMVGFVFQMFYLLPKMTALDNVKLPMLYAGVSEKEQEERAITALKEVGLEARMHHAPNQLSGGQQQRVSIARALVNDPKVIFADEPTGNLDTKSGDEVMDIFTRLSKEGRTIIMVTHEDDIADYAHRKIVLKDGVIIEDNRK
jgi:putative ABC transport system ATP-binding protein